MGSNFSHLFSTSSPSSSSVITATTTSEYVHQQTWKKNTATDHSNGRDGDHLCSSTKENAAKRLRKEFQDIIKDPLSHCSCGPISTDDGDIFNWRGAIFGPDGTPFEGGVFFVTVRFPEDYPFNPPAIKFVTKVFHPNIDEFGNINLDILRDQFSLALTLSNVLLSICSFLDDPNADKAGNRIAKVYREDRQMYDKIARAWTRKYAMG